MIDDMIKENTIPENNRDLFYVADTVDEVFEYLDGYDFENDDVYDI